jgi:hypothetical protein
MIASIIEQFIEQIIVDMLINAAKKRINQDNISIKAKIIKKKLFAKTQEFFTKYRN